MIKAPLFLVGAERSGTTMLRLMLSHHPKIAWLNEFEYAVLMMPDRDGWPNLDAYRNWLRTHRVFLSSGLQFKPRASYPEVVDDFLVQHQRTTGKALIGATVHKHFDRLVRIWPDARFIHLVRDPRDVARSRIAMGWAGSVWVASEAWLEAEVLWAALRRCLEADRQHEMRYETLLADPEGELRRLCRFIGVPYDAQMLEYPRHTTYAAPDPALCQQWRRRLAPRAIRLIEARCGTLMRQHGYEPVSDSPAPPSRAYRAALAMHNRWHRMRFRLRRLGWNVWIQDVLARRIGSSAWRMQMSLRVNQINKQYLQ